MITLHTWVYGFLNRQILGTHVHNAVCLGRLSLLVVYERSQIGNEGNGDLSGDMDLVILHVLGACDALLKSTKPCNGLLKDSCVHVSG